MINVLIPKNETFNYEECEKLYNKCRRFMNENQSFRDIVEKTMFFSIFDEDKFIGCIYYYMRDNDEKLYVNAFAGRHTHLANVEALKKTMSWYNCDIYAETRHKTAILCLYKCGFKKVRNNLYRYER